MRHASGNQTALARLLPATAAALLLAGCSSLLGWHRNDAEPTAPNSSAPAAADDAATAPGKGGVTEEQQLKLARLWNRVDELEEEQFRQKERIRVLEKGLTLGLVPEELKQPQPPEPKMKKPEAKAKPPKAEKAPEAEKPAPGGLSKADEEAYQTGLANAHALYRDGKYGRAIVAYSELTKQFGDKVDNGLPQYWIAKCWSSLGEYESAREQLTQFLKEHPTSPWVPRAKLELARAEWRVGEQESAVATLRGIIEQYPYEDAAEMAKMELESLGKKLELHAPTDLPPATAAAEPGPAPRHVARRGHRRKKEKAQDERF